MLKKILLYLYTLILVLSVAPGYAQDNFSYIYIQGDKETPFYVKLEGEMLPRYGKNYTLIPQLVTGPLTFTILYQQNKYPEQKFTVYVPENGFRTFMLSRRDGTNALYDFQYKFYISENGHAEDDVSPAILNSPFTGNPLAQAAPVTKPDKPEIKVVQSNKTVTKPEPAFIAPKQEPKAEKLKKERKPREENTVVKKNLVKDTLVEDNSLRFLDDIIFNNVHEGSVQQVKDTVPSKIEPTDTVVTIPEQAATADTIAVVDSGSSPFNASPTGIDHTDTAKDAISIIDLDSKPAGNNDTAAAVDLTKKADTVMQTGTENAVTSSDSLRSVYTDTVKDIDTAAGNPGQMLHANVSNSDEDEVKIVKKEEHRFGDTVISMGHKAKDTVNTKIVSASRESTIADTTFTFKSSPESSFYNSDCPQAMAPSVFLNINKKMMEKNKDEERKEFIDAYLNKCYTSIQVKLLAKQYKEDQNRYLFLKSVYSRVSDQQNFQALENLFTQKLWKDEFLKLFSR